MRKISALMRSTSAATAVEYGLIVALIFVAAMGAISAVGGSTIDMWEYVGTKINEVM